MAAAKPEQLRLPLDTCNLAEQPRPVAIDSEFDVELANSLAEKESYNKHLYRPNTYLHKWWARRCGTTFRLILKHLVSDPAHRDYFVGGGLEGQIILDPMMGGGTTLHEAVRLGANVVGVDVEPIPVLQARASLSDVKLLSLEDAFHTFHSELSAQIGHLFRTQCPHCERQVDSQFVLHGLVRKCNCGTALFVDSLVLRHNTDGSTINICPRCCSITAGPCNCEGTRQRIFEKTTKTCSTCEVPYRERLDLPFWSRYEPIAIVGHCSSHGMFFKAPDEHDRQRVADANALRHTVHVDDVADFAVGNGPKSADLLRRHITSYLDVFSSRQLLFIQAAANLLPKYDAEIRLFLALLISTSLEFNSLLCGYKGGDKKRPGAIRHVFSHHAYSFPHTSLENNAVFGERASGTLTGLFRDRLRRGRLWARRPTEKIIQDGKLITVAVDGELDYGHQVSTFDELSTENRRFLVLHASSTTLNLPDNSVDHVVTDPPYSDSVQYSDLAAFFRVWLRRMLPEAVNWDYDVSQSAVDREAHGDGHFARLLGDIFTECHRVLNKSHGRLIFTYHHWSPKAWTALTLALRRARFVLMNRYVVHAENPVSVHISNLNALTDDAILVLAPRETSVPRPVVWVLPNTVRNDTSHAFCTDCATVLGWLLDADISDEKIADTWTALLS